MLSYLSSKYRSMVHSFAEMYDEWYAQKAQYISLQEVLSVFGRLPEIPWSSQQVEIIKGKSGKLYVFLTAGYQTIYEIAKEAAENRRDAAIVKIKDLGFHGLDVFMATKRLATQVRDEGIDCILNRITLQPDFSGLEKMA